MAYYAGKHYIRSKKSKLLFRLLFVFSAFLLIYVLFNLALMPVLKTTAINKAKVVAISTINNAVGKVLKEDDISYDKLMSFEKNSDGQITAVKADTLQINLLKYDITNEVVRDLDQAGTSNMNIPIGNIIGGQLFTGRGPCIQIRFMPVGNVNSKITNTFTSAGINQTRHQIMLNVKADITVIMSAYNVSTSVESDYSIAEVDIVGDVPSTYFEYDPNSSSAGKSS